MGAVIHGIGQGLGLAQHGQAMGPQLHLAGEQAGVVGALVPVADHAGHPHHALQMHALRQAEVRLAQVGPVAHHLGHALPVAHVQENHAAHVPLHLHPAAQRGLPAHVFPADAAAIVRSHHTLSISFRRHPIKKRPSSLWDERRFLRDTTHFSLDTEAILPATWRPAPHHPERLRAPPVRAYRAKSLSGGGSKLFFRRAFPAALAPSRGSLKKDGSGYFCSSQPFMGHTVRMKLALLYHRRGRLSRKIPEKNNPCHSISPQTAAPAR